MSNLKESLQFDQLFVESEPTITDIINTMNQPYDLPYVLQLRFDGKTTDGKEFTSRLCLADLGWFKPQTDSSASRNRPPLNQSLAKLEDMAKTLAHLPSDMIINPDDYFFTLLLPFLAGSSRNSWVIQTDLDDPATPDLVRLADMLRRVKTLYKRNEIITSSARVAELEVSLQEAQIQQEQMVYGQTITQRKLREIEEENQYLKDLAKTLQSELATARSESQQYREDWHQEHKLREAMERSVIEVTLLESKFELREIDSAAEVRKMRVGMLTMAIERDKAYFASELMETELLELRRHVDNEAEDARLSRIQRDELITQLKDRHATLVDLQERYDRLVVKYNHLVEKYDKVAPLAKSASIIGMDHERFEQVLTELEHKFKQHKAKWADDRIALEQRAIQAEADVHTMVEEAEKVVKAYQQLEAEKEEVLAKFSAETQKMAQQLADLEVVLEKNRHHCVELEAENEQLRASNQLRGLEVANTLKDVRRQKIQLESDLYDCKISIQNLTTEKIELQQALDRSKAETERIRTDMRHREILLLRRRGVSDGEDGTIDVPVIGEREVEEMRAQFRTREIELVDAVEDARAQVRQLSFDMSNLQAELERTHKKVIRLNELNQMMTIGNRKLQTELAAAQQQTDALQLKLESTESDLTTANRKLQTELAATQQQTDALQLKLESTESDLTTVNRKLQTELAAAQQQIEALQTELGAAQQQIDALQISSYTKTASSLSTTTANRKLQTELVAAQQQTNALQLKLDSTESNLTTVNHKLKTELTAAQQQIEALQTELGAAQQQIDAFQISSYTKTASSLSTTTANHNLQTEPAATQQQITSDNNNGSSITTNRKKRKDDTTSITAPELSPPIPSRPIRRVRAKNNVTINDNDDDTKIDDTTSIPLNQSNNGSTTTSRKRRRVLGTITQRTINIIPPGTPDLHSRLQSSINFLEGGFTVPDLRTQAATSLQQP